MPANRDDTGYAAERQGDDSALADGRRGEGNSLPVRAKRNKNGQFVKGQSGNPNGRPKKPVNAHEYGTKAYDRIAEMAEKSENERVRLDANKWLAEMAFGKPTQPSEVEGSLDTGTLTVRLEGELAEWGR